MMMESFPTDKAIAFMVSCQSDPTGARRHPVVLSPDWSIDTGPNLDAERIADASGVRSAACPALVERVIPAIRDTWAHRSRRAKAGVRFDRGIKRWVPVTRAPSCAFADRTWQTVGEAAAHLRDLRHWAHMHEADPEVVRRVWDAIGEAIGGWPDTDRVPEAMRELIGNSDDALLLWRAGVHPEWAAETAERLRMDEPLLATTYIHVLVQNVDLDWLVEFTPYGPRTVDWAARIWTGDPATSRSPHEWLAAGFSCWNVDSLLKGPYSPDEVLAFANTMDGSPDDAANHIAGWLNAGCVPSMDQISALWTLPEALRVAPSDSMIQELQFRLDPWRVDLPMTDLALVLAACGSVSVAVDILRRERVVNGQQVIDRFQQVRIAG